MTIRVSDMTRVIPQNTSLAAAIARTGDEPMSQEASEEFARSLNQPSVNDTIEVSLAPGVTRLRVYRISAGFTQVKLAAEAGVDAATVGRLEKGERPSVKTANALAYVLGTTVLQLWPDQILGHEDEQA